MLHCGELSNTRGRFQPVKLRVGAADTESPSALHAGTGILAIYCGAAKGVDQHQEKVNLHMHGRLFVKLVINHISPGSP